MNTYRINRINKSFNNEIEAFEYFAKKDYREELGKLREVKMYDDELWVRWQTSYQIFKAVTE